MTAKSGLINGEFAAFNIEYQAGQTFALSLRQLPRFLG